MSAWLAGLLLLATAAAPSHVSFPTDDGGVVFADVYGSGPRGLVLAHGARFDKESWAKQARVFADAGYRVLALDFRGYGKSHGPGDKEPMSAPLHLDVLAAVRYLRTSGAKSVAIVGGSMGGNAAADASSLAKPGEIEALVLLGSRAGRSPEKIPCRTLVLATKDDADGSGTLRLPNIRASYEKMASPKEILVLDGSAHAQFLFQTDEGGRVMREILRFLAASREVSCFSTAPTRSSTAQRPRPTASFCATS
jgi:dienelactone hydrolase